MLEHVQRGELDPSILIGHRMSLEASPRGYEMFKNREDGCVRAVFAPGPLSASLRRDAPT
jgi:threonine dehydrogenase-like Zn-dependent dehydrogenase